ncbi:MAG TPA: bifunctional adenosylcobinamide kinase/adenosylcobinamide-phosphate guanylyltransferase [Dehalococcoidia bacterium]
MAGGLVLVTGGARSGKSALAERLAARLGGAVLYVATAEAGDAEMADRIRRHRERRPPSWRTLEAPRAVVAALAAAPPADVVLLDCLSLWVSNLLLERVPWEGEIPPAEASAAAAAVEAGVRGLLAWGRSSGAWLIVVSNEVGSGIVPAAPLARLYRDVLGAANQAIAAEADRVYYCVAGRVLDLSGAPAVDAFEPPLPEEP